MKNQSEIIEKIGETQLELESTTNHCGCRSFNCPHSYEIEASVSKHKCLLAYQNALIWVIDIRSNTIENIQDNK